MVVPDKSEFSRCVPLVIGTCTLGWIINVIKESELDRLSTPWPVARASLLLNMRGTVEKDQGVAGDSPMGEGASESSLALDVDEPIFIKENVRLGPLQNQILECRVKPLMGKSAQVMVMPLRVGESQQGGACPLPPGLHVLHMYTRLKMSSSKVSMVVRNMSESPIFLKKGVQVAWVVSASPVPPGELPLRWKLP